MKLRLIPSLLFLCSSVYAGELALSTTPVTSPLLKAAYQRMDKSDFDKAGLYNMGGKLFIDRNVEVSKGFRADRYLELVSTAAPLAPSLGFARFYMSNSSNTLCAVYPSGAIGCFGLATSTTTVTVTAVIAHDPLQYNTGTGDLTLGKVSLSTGTTGAYLISPAGNGGDIQFSSGAVLGSSSNLFWDNRLFRLGVSTRVPQAAIDVGLGSIDATDTNLISSHEGDLFVTDIHGKGYLSAQSVRMAPTGDHTYGIVMQNAGETHTVLDVDTTNNRVGVNTETPKAVLEVVGTVLVDSATTHQDSTTFNGTMVISSGVLASGSAGTSGQALVSNGANTVPTWQTIATAGSGIVSPGTFTWSNTFGITASTLTATSSTTIAIKNSILATDSTGLIVSTFSNVIQYSGLISTNTETDSNTNSYTDATGLSLTITPKLATSHIRLQATISMRLLIGAGNVITGADLEITDSSNNVVKEWPAITNYDITGTSFPNPNMSAVIVGYDAPGSTSSKTYKVRVRRNTNSTAGTVQINNSAYLQISTFEAWEYNQ